MKELLRTAQYRKDETREECLRRFNALIADLDAQVSNVDGPKLPIVFIVGPPRTATTLMSQIFSYAGCFGYISNFVARFYRAPSLGLLVQQAMDFVNTETATFSSEYGVTSGWNTPHEFGYFWDRWFNLGQETHKLSHDLLQLVDRENLRAAISRMEYVVGKPMVFKNNTWCTFQIAFLRKLFPQSIWVVCQRHPLYTAQSIAVGRRRRYGNINTWWSVRPARYHDLLQLPWWDQVAGQVRYTLDEMEEGLQWVDSEDVVRVRYEDICRDPGVPLEAVSKIFQKQGVGLKPKFPQLELRNHNVRTLPVTEWEILHETCNKWFGTRYDGWNMAE